MQDSTQVNSAMKIATSPLNKIDKDMISALFCTNPDKGSAQLTLPRKKRFENSTLLQA
jgi:hypothetical protein